VLRSGRRSRFYLDKYRFETRPDLLGAIGTRLAGRVQAEDPDAARLAGPELGAVALAAAGSLASGLPFLICLVEDIVTSGGAAAAAVEALRNAGLRCDTAICVVDREEGGLEALAAIGVRLVALFRASDILGRVEQSANPHG
jgi:orotate phosphoribosyltransferase